MHSLVGQGRVERPPPDFQSGASTELASAPLDFLKIYFDWITFPF